LRIEIGEAYKILLFKDAHNYAGIKETAPTEVYQHMDIATHLPMAVRNVFNLLVKEYITQIYVHNKKLAKQNRLIEQEDEGQDKLNDKDYISDLITK
jgi:hypothetical protein